MGEEKTMRVFDRNGEYRVCVYVICMIEVLFNGRSE